MAKPTSFMEQYKAIRAECKDALLLFRMGDFYETFGEDAVIAARELNITLTARGKDESGEKIPLAGIPYHALDAYLGKLVKAGHKVAICEQLEDPKKARGIVQRGITRIVTPGTIIEPSMLDEGCNNYLAAILQEGEALGLALADVSTGEFMACELLSTGDALSSELAKFRPSEILHPASLKGRSLEAIDCQRAAVQAFSDAAFSKEATGAALERQFGEGWAASSSHTALALRAAGAVLNYLHETHLDAIGHISDLKPYFSGEAMVLDEVTLRNLEIFRNIRDRSAKGSLLEFLDKTETAVGSRTLQRWLALPTLSLETIGRRLNAVEELIASTLAREELKFALDGAGDLERLMGRISCKSANPKDLIALKNTLLRLPQICRSLESSESDLLIDLREELDPTSLDEVVDLLERAISPDPPTSTKEGGAIREGFDQELDRLRAALRDGRSWIADLEAKEREDTNIKSLKVGYNNVFGYFLEVTKPNLSNVPDRYIRKQTLSNAERFITPELKEMEDQVLSAQERSIALEQDLFSSVRFEIAASSQDVQRLARAMGELDVLLSLATVALDRGFVKPRIDRGGGITLRESRHPVLDLAMRGGFVPNDVHLDREKRFMMLTGPNMAGKSTYMRQVALSVIMAQMGSFVPASFASIGLVDRIFTRVGAYDDLVAGQSTFMVEMTELANILNCATVDSLILLDEIGRGTSTFDGLSIAWAMTEYIHSTVKAKSIFATHYHQLTQLARQLPGIVNYNMAVKEEKGSIVFLRAVVPGASDKSYGIHVAKLAGVPNQVVKRANEILSEIEQEMVLDGKTRSRANRYTQLIFFDEGVAAGPDPSPEDPLLDDIRNLDLDATTPMEALNTLSEYQKALKKR
ncbi:MAG: DNA mismatch repair protein MutS [Methanotrichaceae archaeon]|nr:DNA mismatch repair protein MutS [Methanotrichaceae archaeon]